MKIYLLLAHPDGESFNHAIADAYEAEAVLRGHQVRRQDLGELEFDPILWKGYREIQALEPDLQSAQENILWCERWVVIYPLWWGSVPALLKGFFDRALYSGFAYRYHDKDPLWDGLLKGRTAQIISTCDAPWLWVWWQYRNCDFTMIKRAIFGFCGIETTSMTRITKVKDLSIAERRGWLDRVAKLV